MRKCKLMLFNVQDLCIEKKKKMRDTKKHKSI